ncbi:AAA family ATPase [Geodermatophilus sp. SYSU D00698]
MDDDSARQFYFTFQGAVDDSKSAIRWNSSSEIDGASNIRHGYLPISRVSEGRGRGGRRRTASELIDEAAFDRLFAEQIQEVWRSYSHRALLRIREAQDQGLAGILRSVLLGGNALPPRGQKRETAEEAYKLVQEFFASQRLGRILQLSLDDFRDSYTQNQVVTDVVAEIREVQRGIKSAQEPQRRIESLLSDLYSGGKVVALSGEVGITLDGEPIPLESLSSGEKQLLQLLLETLAADANPVLIDEPELSLHVDWQSRLVECLQTVNENAQLIMATHSPEVMARLADRYVYEI